MIFFLSYMFFFVNVCLSYSCNLPHTVQSWQRFKEYLGRSPLLNDIAVCMTNPTTLGLSITPQNPML